MTCFRSLVVECGFTSDPDMKWRLLLLKSWGASGRGRRREAAFETPDEMRITIVIRLIDFGAVSSTAWNFPSCCEISGFTASQGRTLADTSLQEVIWDADIATSSQEQPVIYQSNVSLINVFAVYVKVSDRIRELCTLQNSNSQMLIKNSKPGLLESSWQHCADWTPCD